MTTIEQPTIENLERRIAILEQNLKNVAGVLIGSFTQQAVVKKKTTAKADKEARKAELLKDCPYSQASLEDLKGFDLKMLGAAMKLKTFGLKKGIIIKSILADQKKAKAPVKKAPAKKKPTKVEEEATA